MLHPAVHPDVSVLREAFGAIGRSAWLVGGAPRDIARGRVPADLDVATDASPREQERAYGRARIRRVPTGAAHGTYTAVLGSGAYQVSSLRDRNLPSVAFGRDLARDLGLRDLTLNAVAMTLEGATIDPHGGLDDLAQGRVRFCGQAADRIREDPIRILRWIRFRADVAPDLPPDPSALDAARTHAPLLAGMPGERIWKEVARTLALPGGVRFPRFLAETGAGTHLGLPACDPARLERSASLGDRRPETLVAALLGHDEDALRRLAERWRWSGAERERAAYVCRHVRAGTSIERLLYVERHPAGRVLDLAMATGRGEEFERISARPAPVFPVRARDLKRIGMEEGPAIGETLERLREDWATGGYGADAPTLLAALAPR